MADEEPGETGEEDLPTVGSGRVDALFDDLESTVESLDGLADELEDVRDRVEADEGDVSGHVRNRITQDADQLSAELMAAAERLRDDLDELKRSV